MKVRKNKNGIISRIVHMNGSVDNREIMRLKADMDLARANLERMQNELEVRNGVISRLYLD